MPRIEPVTPPYSDEVQASFDKLMPKGMEPLKLFRTLAHNPRVLRRIQRGGLLDPGSISMRLRELVILRTCALCGADYEWGVHATIFSAGAELTEAELEATRATASGNTWSEQDRLVLELCDELHTNAAPSQSLWDRLNSQFDSAQLIELVTLAGLYHAVSFIVNATGVEAEDWARAPAR